MSALENDGIEKFWAAIEEHRDAMVQAGMFERNRSDQQVKWMWSMVHETLLQRLASDDNVRDAQSLVESQLRDGQITPTLGAERIIEAFDRGRGST